MNIVFTGGHKEFQMTQKDRMSWIGHYHNENLSFYEVTLDEVEITIEPRPEY